MFKREKVIRFIDTKLFHFFTFPLFNFSSYLLSSPFYVTLTLLKTVC